MARFAFALSVATLVALAGWAIAPALERSLHLAQLLAAPVPRTVAWPLERHVVRGVTDSWGAPRPGGRRHEGVDIFAPRGSPVHSTTWGIIWRTGEDPLGGRVVWLLGPGGDLHYYAHLERIGDLAPGQRLAVGTVVGYVGTSGNAARTPPHLHYGVYRHGRAINPYPLLVADERGGP